MLSRPALVDAPGAPQKQLAIRLDDVPFAHGL
jgi:hypothetical protein